MTLTLQKHQLVIVTHQKLLHSTRQPIREVDVTNIDEDLPTWPLVDVTNVGTVRNSRDRLGMSDLSYRENFCI